jgi:hypothetical protein
MYQWREECEIVRGSWTTDLSRCLAPREPKSPNSGPFGCWYGTWQLTEDVCLCVVWQTELTLWRSHLQEVCSRTELDSNGLQLHICTGSTQRTCKQGLVDAPRCLSHSCLQSSQTCKSVLIHKPTCLEVLLSCVKVNSNDLFSEDRDSNEAFRIALF